MTAFHVTCTWTTAIGADGAWLLAVKDMSQRPGLQGLGYQYVSRLGDLTERVRRFIGKDTTVDALTVDFVVPPEIQAHLDTASDALAAAGRGVVPAVARRHGGEARRLLFEMGLTPEEIDLVMRDLVCGSPRPAGSPSASGTA